MAAASWKWAFWAKYSTEVNECGPWLTPLEDLAVF